MTDRNRRIWLVVGSVALTVAVLVTAGMVLRMRFVQSGDDTVMTGVGGAPDSPPTSSASSPGPPAGHHPTPATTGVPPGTRLTTLPLSGDTYRITDPGTVLDGVHIPGNVLVTADGVIIRNSQIDGMVLDEYSRRTYSFTITDSTVGPAQGCLTLPAIGVADFTATRVHVRGHGDGFRASGDNVKIYDSYVDLCSNPGDHSDGIQTYLTGRGLVLHHTTIDQRGVEGTNAPVFIVDEQTVDVAVTDNLLIGGTYSIQVRNAKGKVIVRNNRVVDGSWQYGPVYSDCDTIEWSGNTVVTIDDNYRITSVVADLPC
jgi:Right handed beta helix region